MGGLKNLGAALEKHWHDDTRSQSLRIRHRQITRLQETPDAVSDGQTPHTVSLCVFDELVDLAKPGDRLTVTGIFCSVAVRINPRMRTIKSLFKAYLDAVHIKRGSDNRMGYDKSTRSGALSRK